MLETSCLTIVQMDCEVQNSSERILLCLGEKKKNPCFPTRKLNSDVLLASHEKSPFSDELLFVVCYSRMVTQRWRSFG